jgi:hypothetical protein
VPVPKRPRPTPRGKKNAKAPQDPAAPIRRSIWIGRELFREIEALATTEDRKPSDMIRVLLRRGIVATRRPTSES